MKKCILFSVSGFIDFIVKPSLDVCGELLDKIFTQSMGIISSGDLLASDSDDAGSSTSGHHSHSQHHRHHHKHSHATSSPANRKSDGREKGKIRPKSLTSLIVDKTCILKKHSPEDDDDLTGHNNNGDNNKPAATAALQSTGSSVDPHSKDNCPLAAAASSEATCAASSHGQTVR